MARIFRGWDAPYAATCLQAARRAFDWVSRQTSRKYVDWGTGAGAGFSLFEATEDRRYLDWILGANPFAVSFMQDVGYSNPPEYIYTGFHPRTPRLSGAVMCGIAGDLDDRPDLQAGSYHTCEIGTPMLIQTLCLMHERMREQTSHC